MSNTFPKTISMTDRHKVVHTAEVKNEQELKDHLAAGWTLKYEHQKFPMALHGPKGTGKTVANEEELEQAKAKGFSEEPIPEETEK